MSVLRADNVVKHYPGTVALSGVSVEFDSGRIHAFVGKNGSGKSTLLKIISGSETATSGDLYLDDRKLNYTNTKDALENGIVTVYQELSLVSSLSVTENFYLGRLPLTKSGTIDWKHARAGCREALNNAGLGHIDPDAPVQSLGIGDQQMLEIIKAVDKNPKVLLLDEPTSALSLVEVETLFRLMRTLKERGIIIIFVTHRLQELWAVADTCTVLRDGSLIGQVEMSSIDRPALIRMMLGDIQIREIPTDLIPDRSTTVLEVKNLCRGSKCKNVSFQLKKGEVLGIAGMIGAGRTELLESIFGAQPYDSGQIILNGKLVTNATPEKMKALGLVMVQEDRANNSVIKSRNIQDNICIACLDRIVKFFIGSGLERKKAEEEVRNMEIKIGGLDDGILSLSGGNQQKVILGRWLATNPSVILFDEPSRGIDVGTKQQIFQKIWDLCKEGMSSIVVSSELEELIEVCTRIIIMIDGRITGEITAPQTITADQLYLKCMED